MCFLIIVLRVSRDELYYYYYKVYYTTPLNKRYKMKRCENVQ